MSLRIIRNFLMLSVEQREGRSSSTVKMPPRGGIFTVHTHSHPLPFYPPHRRANTTWHTPPLPSSLNPHPPSWSTPPPPPHARAGVCFLPAYTGRQYKPGHNHRYSGGKKLHIEMREKMSFKCITTKNIDWKRIITI